MISLENRKIKGKPLALVLYLLFGLPIAASVYGGIFLERYLIAAIALCVYVLFDLPGLAVSSIFAIALPWRIIAPYSVTYGDFWIYSAFTIYVLSRGFKYEKTDFTREKSAILVPVILIFLFLFVGISRMRFWFNGFHIIIKWIEGFMMFALVTGSIKNEGQARVFATGLMAMLVLASYLGMYQYISGTTRWNLYGYNRVDSTFLHSNIFAGAIAFISPFFIAAILDSKPLKEKVMYALLFLPVIISLIWTYSRGGWVSFMIAAAALIIIRKGRSAFFIITIIFALALLILFLLPPDLGQPVISKIFFGQYGPGGITSWRVDYWAKASKALLEHPLLGYGPGRHYALYKNFSNAHNLYLEYWVWWGLYSLSALLFMAVYIWRKSLRMAVSAASDTKRYLSLSICGCFTAFLVNGCVEFQLVNTAYFVIFMSVVGIFFVINTE